MTFEKKIKLGSSEHNVPFLSLTLYENDDHQAKLLLHDVAIFHTKMIIENSLPRDHSFI